MVIINVYYPKNVTPDSATFLMHMKYASVPKSCTLHLVLRKGGIAKSFSNSGESPEGSMG